MTHSDVCAALGLADGGGPGSIRLANLRARLWDVPPILAAARTPVRR
jgi:hypothetical protein